jgi:hypothetical protein
VVVSAVSDLLELPALGEAADDARVLNDPRELGERPVFWLETFVAADVLDRGKDAGGDGLARYLAG